MWHKCLFACLLVGFTAASSVRPCPDMLSPAAFSLPGSDPTTDWSPVLAYRNQADPEGGGSGLSFIDVNGDSLVDLVWSYELDVGGSVDDDLWQCVYLNTQCGWGKSIFQVHHSGIPPTAWPLDLCSFRSELHGACDDLPPCIVSRNFRHRVPLQGDDGRPICC